MSDPAPYFTWSDVAMVVDGEKRLLKLLMPSSDTAEDHPKFDAFAQIAVDRAESEFSRGGYRVPLPTPLTDAALRNAMIGAFVGYVTEGKSDVEPWIENLSEQGLSWLKKIGDGQAIKGATLEETASASNDGHHGAVRFNTRARFALDMDDPDSDLSNIFGDLGGGARNRRGF